MKRRIPWLAIGGLLLVLGAANYTIMQRQQVLDDGQPLLLELRPVDPRSLMQGDYMVLRYAESLFPPPGKRADLPDRGALVVQLDANNVATFARLDDGGELAANEARLRYKQVGAESYFFQEGRADDFDAARYGVLHVDSDGNSVLVGLADEQHRLIQ